MLKFGFVDWCCSLSLIIQDPPGYRAMDSRWQNPYTSNAQPQVEPGLRLAPGRGVVSVCAFCQASSVSSLGKGWP